MTNPTVHIALNQIRQVVNEIIKRYGHPDSISIELSRDLPAGKIKIEEIKKKQRENQEQNQRLNEKLREHGQLANRENRLRLLLWEELDKDPCGRCCPFSGDKIGIADLFNGSAEIEHLIPFSQSLYDGWANKVICTRKANRDKKNRTPHEAFGNNPNEYSWDEIFERSKRLPKAKQQFFQEDALEIWQSNYGDFLERHLNDVRYIGRLAREYLENICPFNKIDVVTGKLTSLLRYHWGLNNLLDATNSSGNKFKKKNRDDHRHHAIDAIVIGMTTRSILQKVSVASKKAESLQLDYLFEKRKNGKSPIDPWGGFRDQVIEVINNIVVSHKSKRKKSTSISTDGQLHKKTAYKIVSKSDKKGLCNIVVRKPITKFDKLKIVESILDKHLRKQFMEAFNKNGKQGVQELAGRKKIRSLRTLEENKRVISIKDKEGRVYKAYKSDSNWGMEIYQYPPTHKDKDKWVGIVISRYEANQKGFTPGQTRKPHPAARLIMRLQTNDCIQFQENNQKKIVRLQKMDQTGRLCFAKLHEANVDSRDRDKNDSFKYSTKTDQSLKKSYAKKIHISPTGLISYERRKNSF